MSARSEKGWLFPKGTRVVVMNPGPRAHGVTTVNVAHWQSHAAVHFDDGEDGTPRVDLLRRESEAAT